VNWHGKKILVTGAGGFIGSHLVEALVKSGANVRALVHYNSRNDWGLIELLPEEIRQQLDVVAGDVRDAFMMRNVVKGCRIVFHLAALIGIPYSYVAPDSYVDTNVKGTLNVLQASLSEAVERVIHTSTSEVYGTARYIPIDEKHPLQGQSVYSASKIGADKIAESFYCSFNLPVSIIRPFNTYGPRQSARAILPTIVTQALANSELKLGSLVPVRDLTYVKDTVDGFLKMAESENSVGELINIGTGVGISIGALAERITTLLGKKFKIVRDEQRVRPEKSEVMELVCDARKAKAMIGWEPRVSLDEGLRKTIQWARANMHLYKPEIYHI